MARKKKSTFERLQSGEMNRKQRRALRERLCATDPGLEVVHADAAGIDVGNASHFVAVPPDRDEVPVREFGSWTADLKRMAAWLKECGIRTVAMQSTGVYWIAVQEVLEAEGLEVYLVNARGTKNLPGRKSDVQECQWLMKLHTYGLLRNSFRPPEEIRAVRTIWRQRDRRVTATVAEIAHSLEGNWREDVLFELRQVVEAYDFYQRQMAACDVELKKYMAALPDRRASVDPALSGSESPRRDKSKHRRKNKPGFDLGAELRRTTGVDLTAIDGIDILTGQVILSEVGPDLSAFPSEDHFAAWLELAPRRDISGGKLIRHVKPEGRNRIANALRMAAQALSKSDSYLGARYRSLRGRLGGPKANKAMARYLACLVYRLLTKGQAYVDRGAMHYESKRQEREMNALQRKAANLGMRLVPAA
jgi:transposase